MMNGASASSSNPSSVQGICPSGWHIGSDSEWNAITGMSATDLKSTSGWNGGGNGTNSSGFNVYSTGYFLGASFSSIGNTSAFWTTTNRNADPTVYGIVSFLIRTVQ